MNKLIIRFWVFGICCVVFGITANAQTWQWGRRGGGSAGLNNFAEKIVDMMTDANGNVYMLARFDGGGDENLDTGNGDSIALQTNGVPTAVFFSYNCSGKLRWAKVFRVDNGKAAPVAMTIDSLNHIYIALATQSLLHIDVDSFVTNSKTKTIGIAQYDTAGHFKWFRQPNPDSVSTTKNVTQYRVFNSATLPNGDTYLFCALGTGLIAGSNNLVVPTAGLYFLKYNVAGVATELIKPDMRGNGVAFNWSNFSVTKNRKFVFTAVRSNVNTKDSLIVGGQQIKHPVFLCCFSPTGNVLWKVENTDTTSGIISGRPFIDESKGLIYVVGGEIWGTQIVDTLGGIPIINAGKTGYGSKGFLPFSACLDTLGNYKKINWGSCYINIGNSLNNLTFRSDGRMFATGYGGGIIWDGFNFYGGNGGYQTFMPSFDATTGSVMSMDSLKSNNGASYGDVIAADKNNNIYVGGHMANDVVVAGQTLQTFGGQCDFFVAKYGYPNCSVITPLKIINYSVNQLQSDKIVIENNWITVNEENMSHYNIQRSIDGSSFTSIGTVTAKNWDKNSYTFKDIFSLADLNTNKPFNGNIYYRLESLDREHKKEYSQIKSINLSPNIKFSLYPNPTKNFVNIQCKEGIKQLLITDYLGKKVYQSTVNGQQSTVNCKQLPKGLHIVQITTTKGNMLNEKLVIE